MTVSFSFERAAGSVSLLLSLLLVPGSEAIAQEFAPNVPARIGAETREQLLEGQRLIEARDPRAVSVRPVSSTPATGKRVS